MSPLKYLVLSWLYLSVRTTRIDNSNCKDVLFEKFSRSPLPYSVLQTTADDRSNLIPCTLDTKVQSGNSVVVVLAISDCLDDNNFAIIKNWVDQLGSKSDTNKYLKTRDNVQLKFQTVIIKGNCQTQAGTSYQGDINADESYAISRNLASYDAREERNRKRAASFSSYGKVSLNFSSTTEADRPAAVVSFCNDVTSFKQVTSYEQNAQIENIFNFEFCDSGSICKTNTTKGFKLKKASDVSLYNPFSSIRSWKCPKLKNGIPVSYVDASNNPSCFCDCPAGYKMVSDRYGSTCSRKESDQCPCTWSNEGPFYHAVKPGDYLPQCRFTNISSSWKIPAPFPIDSYVSGKRTAFVDDKTVSADSRIELRAERKSVAVYDLKSINSQSKGKECDQKQSIPSDVTPNKVKGYPESFPSSVPATYGWIDYQKNGPSRVDKLTFSGYGQYKLSLTAYDVTGSYGKEGKTPKTSSSKCEGCLAIVDQTRPRRTETCPSRFCEGPECQSSVGFAEATSSNLKRANAAIMNLYKVQQTASNDACSVQNRCDEELFEMKDFHATTYKKQSNYRSGQECFNTEQFRMSLLRSASTKKNPFGKSDILQKSFPVAEGQCQRCCRLSMKLQERWVDYNCKFKFYTERCEGIFGEGCELDQCLQTHGNTLVTATAAVAPSYINESTIVKKSLPNGELQTRTEIHVSLDCTDSQPDCVLKASVNSLIVRREYFSFDIPGKNSEFSAAEYVFWRYKVVSDGLSQWQQFSENQVHTWKTKETEIIVEAWTQCGLAYRFPFSIVLRRNPPVTICNSFPSMWYQTTTPHSRVSNTLCSYKKSNFLELTFDYHPSLGSKNSQNSPDMGICNIMCTMEYEGASSIEILRVENTNSQVVKHFAIDLARAPKSTNSIVARCDFSYTNHAGGSETHTCDQTFLTAVCDESDKAVPDAKCKYDTCPATKSSAYELCYGDHIFMTPDRRTVLSNMQQECCPTCGAQTACVPILQSQGNAKSLYRCEPKRPSPAPKSGNYRQENSNYKVLTANTLLSDESIQDATGIADEQVASDRKRFVFEHPNELSEMEQQSAEMNGELQPTLETNEDPSIQSLTMRTQNIASDSPQILDVNQEVADVEGSERPVWGQIRARANGDFENDPSISAENDSLSSLQDRNRRFVDQAHGQGPEGNAGQETDIMIPQRKKSEKWFIGGQNSFGNEERNTVAQINGQGSINAGGSAQGQTRGQRPLSGGSEMPLSQINGQGSGDFRSNNPKFQINGQGSVGSEGNSPLVEGQGSLGLGGISPLAQINGQGSVGGGGNIPLIQGRGSVGLGGNNPGAPFKLEDKGHSVLEETILELR
ncbi:Ev167 [Albugo candida]|uniref:Ev167 protein n=1 Tax=Albugo candida TaxID=65357 RepID=A0A024GG53_9STRA|nr:Ev167 [Albugo candida]|eukprot:CCI45743.1 Ev167 [Albugo candida]